MAKKPASNKSWTAVSTHDELLTKAKKVVHPSTNSKLGGDSLSPFIADSLPVIKDVIDYELEAFIPIKETDDDRATTESDLAAMNNVLAMCNGALPFVRTISSLVALSGAVCKAVEIRRKVKKLQFGAPNEKALGKVFEVIE